MKKTTLAAAVLAGVALIGYPVYRSVVGVDAVQVDASEQSLKIAEYANLNAFITPDSLKKLMDGNNNVIVIGALNPSHRNAPIHGSYTVWREDYSDNFHTYGGMRAEHDELEKMLGEFGATTDSTIVVYAANDHHDAARLMWQIQMLGHEDVRYLDGGLNAWAGANLPTGNANPATKPTLYEGSLPDESHLATYEMVVKAITEPDWVILDTRGLNEHDGSTTLSGAAGPGTIPGSVHVEWSQAKNDDTTLKSIEELKAIYGELIEGKKVIAYCQSGVRSAHTTMVLKDILGAEKVYNYDGSWIEWSEAHYLEARKDAPVINGRS